ncbi:c-type cytochrome [Gemmatimonas sp.]|uniref:c-type cytochrome n=1 Tax=Gemmatimonas sp. TaxID=1962908 RepID=UPI0039837DEF
MTGDGLPPRQRENQDPDEQVRPIPRLVIGMLVIGVAWGAWYLTRTSTDVSPLFGDARTVAAFNAAPASDRVDGAQVYAGKCAACHQASGAGLAGIFPPLAASPWVTGSEQRVVQILLHGIQGPIDVLGTTYNGLMPSWKTLSDAELAAVASYVRGAFGNQAPAITAELVAAERAATASRVTPWTGGAELELVK